MDVFAFGLYLARRSDANRPTMLIVNLSSAALSGGPVLPPVRTVSQADGFARRGRAEAAEPTQTGAVVAP